MLTLPHPATALAPTLAHAPDLPAVGLWVDYISAENDLPPGMGDDVRRLVSVQPFAAAPEQPDGMDHFVDPPADATAPLYAPVRAAMLDWCARLATASGLFIEKLALRRMDLRAPRPDMAIRPLSDEFTRLLHAIDAPGLPLDTPLRVSIEIERIEGPFLLSVDTDDAVMTDREAALGPLGLFGTTMRWLTDHPALFACIERARFAAVIPIPSAHDRARARMG